VAATSFTGLGTNTLTWRFNPISQGSFITFLEGSGPNALTDAAGHRLGNSGGFTEALKILWGDFDGDGLVNSRDLNNVTNISHTPQYNIYADLNGDGVVNAADIAIVQSRQGGAQK
jgi:hypothetical protein